MKNRCDDGNSERDDNGCGENDNGNDILQL